MALDSYSQDVLAAHYTGAAKVETDLGYAKWPRGAEAHLKPYEGVCFFLAKLDGTLSALLIACESGKRSKLDPFTESAERAVREAHRAYYLIASALEDPEQTAMTGGYFEAMSDFSEQPLSQTDGIWRQ